MSRDMQVGKRAMEWLRCKLWHFMGMIPEPWYTWVNALANTWIRLWNPERIAHPGTLHPDKIFYAITDLPYSVGVAGWHDRVLGYMLRAETKGWIPVVVANTQGARRDDGDWYAFFKPVSGFSADEALRSKNVVIAVPQGMIHKRYNKRNIMRRHRLCGNVHLSDEAESFVSGRIQELFRGCPENMVAVRFRGTDYRYAVGHARVPDVEAFCDTVESDMKRWGVPVGNGEHILVVTEEQEALDAIRRRFPACRFVEKERFLDDKTGKYLCDRRLQTMTPKMNNMFYLLEIYALSRCDYLIGGVNGGVLMALNLNGNRYRGVHVLDTGVN